MVDFSKVIVPEDVINPREYKKMLVLKEHPILKNTIYISSEGDEINIGMLPHILEKRIAHLSPKEQEQIREMKVKYNQIRAKITTAHALAYGRAGCLGGKNKQDLAKYRLSPFEEDIIELLGRMFTIGEVVKIMGEDNHIVISENDVKEVLKKHIGEIEKKREEFRTKVTDVRLYNKRPRLEELAWMYSKMKMRYIAINSIDAYNAMLRTLEQIRKEAEGDVINFNGVLDINIEATIQEHIQAEILRSINLKEVILSRVAARMNYDPVKLITGLHNSYYSKFVDISGEYDENAEMKYPSSSPYDFAQIERQADSNAMDLSPEPMKEEERSTAVNVKELFLAKIRKQRQEMEQRQAYWQSATATEAKEEHEVKRGKGRGKDDDLKSKSAKQRKDKREYYPEGKKPKE